MPKIFSQIIIYASLCLVLVGIISGSVYVYKYNTAKKQDFNSVVQTFNAKAQAQAEVDKLSVLKDTYTAQSQLNDVAIGLYTPIVEAVSETDTYFTNPNSTHPILKLQTSASTQSEIDTVRQKVNALLIELQNIIATIHNSGTVNTTLIDETNSLIDQIETYLTQLQSLGADVGPVQDTMNSISDELASAEASAGVTDTDNQVNYQPVTQNDIEQQQQVVDQLGGGSSQPDSSTPGTSGEAGAGDDSVDTGFGGNTGSGSSNSPVIPAQNTSGTPQLIEGANSY